MQLVDFSYAAIAVLVVGLAVGAIVDLRTREVDDRLWLAIALLGGGLQGVVVGAGGTVPLLVWLLVLAFVIQHLLPWDEMISEQRSAWAGYLELVTYVGVGVILAIVGWRDGVGPTGLPVAAIAVYVSVLLARALFEANLLYGGADAKAVMVAAAAVPFDTMTLLAPNGPAASILSFYPFAVTVLMNGALAAIVVPLALVLRNARHGHWNGLRTFTGYPLSVEQLPDRFVWVTDPNDACSPARSASSASAA
ncbi:MAG: prepilin peptidase, partial [Thermoplasmata archaeon]|nr:prepilin peptidase [Thermoplasmata archaeon]